MNINNCFNTETKYIERAAIFVALSFYFESKRWFFLRNFMITSVFMTKKNTKNEGKTTIRRRNMCFVENYVNFMTTSIV